MPGIDEFTKLMLHMNSDFTDSSDGNHTPTLINTPTISTSDPFFGAGNGNFVAASSQAITFPDHSDFHVAAEDFVIDLRFKTASTVASSQRFYGQVDSGGTTVSISFYGEINAAGIFGSVNIGGVLYNVQGSDATLDDSAWHHYAFIRDGGTLRLFADGVADGTNADGAIGSNSVNNSSAVLGVSRHGAFDGVYFDGDIDEVRISVGTTRGWEGGFTPPAEEYSIQEEGGEIDMTLDSVLNFAEVAVSSVGYNTTDATVVLVAGHGARLPVASYNVTWWDVANFPNPADADNPDPKREIVRVTAVSTDTLTVVRGQETTDGSPVASNKNTAGGNYRMSLDVTSKMINDIDATFLKVDLSTSQTIISPLVIDTNTTDTTAILSLKNNLGTTQVFHSTTTPETNRIGSRGDLCVGKVGGEGIVFVKHTGDASTTGWKELNISHYADMHLHNNSVATVLNTDAVPHLIQGLFSEQITDGFTFSLGSSSAITDTNNNSGTLRITSAGHGLPTGAIVTTTGLTTAAQNDITRVTNIGTNTYDCDDIAYVTASETGTWYEGDKLTADTGSSGIYKLEFHCYGSPDSAGTNTYEFEIFQNTTAIENVEAKRAFSNATDVGNVGGGGISTVEDGDIFTFALIPDGNTQDFTFDHINFVIHKI